MARDNTTLQRFLGMLLIWHSDEQQKLFLDHCLIMSLSMTGMFSQIKPAW
jgi:hypothetical protein